MADGSEEHLSLQKEFAEESNIPKEQRGVTCAYCGHYVGAPVKVTEETYFYRCQECPRDVKVKRRQKTQRNDEQDTDHQTPTALD